MRTLQFSCTLLSDVILNAQARTSGSQQTLDFIPGGNFLGIVASQYNSFSVDRAMELFHSGKVRFGDAHPVAPTKPSCRTLHAPLSWYFPKGKSIEQACYLHHFYNREEDKLGIEGKPQQLKQCRNGFYAFEGDQIYKAETPVSFAIKSAYDRENRRSKDKQMYGYASLDAGTAFLFEVEVDDDQLAEDIVNNLVGIRRIGRSRTAQYGLVKIEETHFDEPRTKNSEGLVYVYADSRLIFLSKQGQPHFRPNAEDLGLPGGQVMDEKTQVRTFQYAPWNYKRQCRDTDRCGIEKGSVFVVEGYHGELPSAKYIGSYQNEGFGHVIYNPEFLLEHGENGLIELNMERPAKEQPEKVSGTLGGTPLLDYLHRAQQEAEAEQFIYEAVKNYNFKSKDKAFASQWGKIRSVAMTCNTAEELRLELFDKKKRYHHYSTPDDPKEGTREKEAAYLMHGVASKKWKEEGGKKIKQLKTFIDTMANSPYGDLACLAVVNLASYTAKEINKKKNEQGIQS